MNLISKIKEGSVAIINNQDYKVITKAFYKTDGANEYIKCILEGHMVLVVSDVDDFICFGNELKNPVYEDLTDSNLKYKGAIYNKVAEDYQRVEKIEFGDPKMIEGELQYFDYESEDGNSILSLTPNHESDTLLNIIDSSEIVIK